MEKKREYVIDRKRGFIFQPKTGGNFCHIKIFATFSFGKGWRSNTSSRFSVYSLRDNYEARLRSF